MQEQIKNTDAKIEPKTEKETEKEFRERLKSFMQKIVEYIGDPTIQTITIRKNKKNDQIFLSITRHKKYKHKVQRYLK